MESMGRLNYPLFFRDEDSTMDASKARSRAIEKRNQDSFSKIKKRIARAANRGEFGISGVILNQELRKRLENGGFKVFALGVDNFDLINLDETCEYGRYRISWVG